MDRQILERVIRSGLSRHSVENSAAVASTVADRIEMALEMESEQALPDPAPRNTQVTAPLSWPAEPPLKSPIMTPSDPGFRAIMTGQATPARAPVSSSIARVAGGPREMPQLLKELEEKFPIQLFILPLGSDKEICLHRNIVAIANFTRDADPNSPSGGAKILYSHPDVSHMEVTHLFFLGEIVQVEPVLNKIAEQAKSLYRKRTDPLNNTTPVRPGELTFTMSQAQPHDSVD